MQLNQFKQFDATRMSLDELVELAMYGRALRTEYEQLALEEPEFVDIQLKAIRREIQTRNADKLESRLRELKVRREALKTPTQKKADIEKEIRDLEKQLQEV